MMSCSLVRRYKHFVMSFVDIREDKDIRFLRTKWHNITDQKIIVLKCTALKMSSLIYLYFIVISSSLIYKWKFACTWLDVLWGQTLRRMWISLSKLCTLEWVWWSGHPESCYFFNMLMQQCVWIIDTDNTETLCVAGNFKTLLLNLFTFAYISRHCLQLHSSMKFYTFCMHYEWVMNLKFKIQNILNSILNEVLYIM
jgi:hypothetical protein